ncbi:MAG: phenylalanine--tRNA ligase beta subunit-related protein [Heliomarina sp.]|uniref:phenylalanine--tRNA ligase beta subunit-related protein n=1 Tax=Heliomarina sp. TaxID=2917556 RepID=UPI00405847E3
MPLLHSHYVQQTFRGRAIGLLTIGGIETEPKVTEAVDPLTSPALQRLETEGAFPEIRSCRRAYSTMALKPTRSRCASEALLRRLRPEGTRTSLDPLFDPCNVALVAYDLHVSVCDFENFAEDLTVHRAMVRDVYLTFTRDVEAPDISEVIFADDAGTAHACRLPNRQSRKSAVSPETTQELSVIEPLNHGCSADIQRILEELARKTSDTSFLSSNDMGKHHVD